MKLYLKWMKSQDILGQRGLRDTTTCQASVGMRQATAMKVGSSNGSRNWHHPWLILHWWWRSGRAHPETWLSMSLDPWLWAHVKHTTKFFFSPKQDGFVYDTIGELLHSSWPQRWESPTLPGSVKLFSSESHHADFGTMPWPCLGN